MIVHHFAFKADGIETHVLSEAEFGFSLARRPSQEHVGRPGGAAEKHTLSIHAEEQRAFVGHLRLHFADAERGGGRIRNVAAGFECEARCVKIGSPIW